MMHGKRTRALLLRQMVGPGFAIMLTTPHDVSAATSASKSPIGTGSLAPCLSPHSWACSTRLLWYVFKRGVDWAPTHAQGRASCVRNAQPGVVELRRQLPDARLAGRDPAAGCGTAQGHHLRPQLRDPRLAPGERRYDLGVSV